MLTAPVDASSGYGLVGSGYGVVWMATPDPDFVCTVANLTISNVLIETANAIIYCGYGNAHDRWSQVVSNVVVTHCANTNNFWSYSAIGVQAGGCALVTDCLFTDLRLSSYCMVGMCNNGGWFRNCRIENCTYGGCGLINCVETVSAFNVVEGCTFSNNVGYVSSACVYGVPVLRDSLFVDNSGVQAMAGIWGNNAFYTNDFLRVEGCTFLRNVSTNGAGGLSFSCGGTVSNCTFSGNSSTENCAGAQNPLEVVDCTFTSNACSQSADWTYASGALHYNGGNAAYARQKPRVANCRFVGNSSLKEGGAIRTTVPMTVEGCTFEGNSANAGGAVECYNGVSISNCTFSGNSASWIGGGIRSEGLDGAVVTDCVFTNNMAGGSGIIYGGAGIYVDLYGSTVDVALTLRNCLFVGNVLTNEAEAGVGSAAVLMSRNGGTARILVESCTMVENRAACGSPSALYVYDSTVGATFVTNTVIARNRGADGSYAPAYSGIWGVTSDMPPRIGHSYFHPNTGVQASWWTEEQHVTDSNDEPAFKEGTWIPTRKSALCNAGVFQAWMDGAFDLQRNDNGKAFVKRVYGEAPDIGAFERAPSGGFSIIVR